MLTLEEAKTLKKGDTLYQLNFFNKDGGCFRWKVAGKIRLWKRNKRRIQIPVRRGRYIYHKLTELDFYKSGTCPHFSLTEEIVLKKISLQGAKELKPGQMLYYRNQYDIRGNIITLKVRGKVKTWKRNPTRIRVPLKSSCGEDCYLTEEDFDKDGICKYFIGPVA